MRMILASASPRRSRLLGKLGLEFEVIPSDGEEAAGTADPALAAEELAAQKAKSVAALVKSGAEPIGDGALGGGLPGRPEGADAAHGEGTLVIGADTVVAHGGEILGKPADEAEAYRMLSSLSGDTHYVYTGVCLVYVPAGGSGQAVRTFHEETAVEFYPMSDEEIRGYIATGDPMDKAGAYGIQSGAGKYIRGIRGDYDNVVGLPTARLYHELKELGEF